jgi:hypothetical protein
VLGSLGSEGNGGSGGSGSVIGGFDLFKIGPVEKSRIGSSNGKSVFEKPFLDNMKAIDDFLLKANPPISSDEGNNGIKTMFYAQNSNSVLAPNSPPGVSVNNPRLIRAFSDFQATFDN